MDPALAAAYNAAFATLQDRGAPSFPDLSQLPPGSVPIALGGQLGVPQSGTAPASSSGALGGSASAFICGSVCGLWMGLWAGVQSGRQIVQGHSSRLEGWDMGHETSVSVYLAN